MSEQPRLFEFRMGERSPDTLVVSDANRDAARLLTEWQTWPSGGLALIGPKGSGKTHLALAWALEVGARQLEPESGSDAAAAAFRDGAGRLLIEDAETADEAALWRVLDMARAGGGAVLLTGVKAPREWAVELPDLRSRLAALPVARLKEPDEALMDVVLRRICREQFIQLSDDAAQYLVRRLPRTFAAAQACAAALDAELVRGAKPVSLAIAKKALARMEAARGGEDG